MGFNRKEKQNIMIKPTHDCNMNCYYCFVNNLTKKFKEQRLSFKTLNKAFQVLSNSANEVNIIWHGGEPTMTGPLWYKNMLDLSYLYSERTTFNHSMQTNGLTLDEEWANLVNNYGIDISISFDGIFQDYRKRDTKKIVEKNILDFKKRTGKAGCLSVITEDSYEGIIDNYEYFKTIGVPVSFNYGINPDYDKHGNYNGIVIDKYMKEYAKYMKHWIYDEDGQSERSVETIIDFVAGLGGGSCAYSDCRYNWMNLNPDGSVTHCNRFFSDDLGMGSIWDIEHVDELYITKGYKKFVNLVQKRLDSDCSKCEYFKFCNGGCNSMHFMNTGSMSLVDKSYCELFKSKFTSMYKLLKNIDLNNKNINPHLLRRFHHGVFSHNEIKDFLFSHNIDMYHFSLDEKNLIDSPEYKLYRIFNPLSETSKGHIDYFVNERNDFNMANRLNDLDKIFYEEKANIFKLLV